MKPRQLIHFDTNNPHGRRLIPDLNLDSEPLGADLQTFALNQ